MEAPSFLHFVQLGFTHVIPLGFDHILFILTLFFLSSDLKKAIVQCSVFTIAHSISLGLTATGIIINKPSVIEPLIALSILFTSLEIIIGNKITRWHYLVLFLFGLVHGMGFAGALLEDSNVSTQLISSLLGFNLGVELGQLLVIMFIYFIINNWFKHQSWYYSKVVYPFAAGCGCIAIYWTIVRIVQ